MNQAAYNILRPTACEYIKSVLGLTVEQDFISLADNKQQIDDNTPITASYLDGSYKSVFKDDVWIISETSQINFTTGVEGLSFNEVLELKTLTYLFLEIPFPRANGLYKTRLAPKTAFIRASTLKALKKTNTLKSKPILSIFTDINVANQLAREIQDAEINKTPLFSLIFANLQAIISHVKYLSLSYINIKPVSSESLNRVLEAIYKRARAQSEQHTVIPPIIYSQIYNDAIDIIKSWNFDKFKNDADDLISAYTDLSDTGSNNHKPAGISRKAYQNRLNKYLTHEEKIYERPGNYEYFKDKIKSVGQVKSTSFFHGSRNITGITFEIRRIQAFLARLILLETSMRENELIHLLNEPIEAVPTAKGSVFLILGKETKISGGQRVGWVVSKNGKIAHEILRQLSDFSYQIQIRESSRPRWLFPRLACSLVDKNSNNKDGKWGPSEGRVADFKAADDKPTTITSLFKYKNPSSKWAYRTGEYALSSADVNFLRTYSTLSNCLNDNVQPDQVFSISEHQFRRSLAFYGSASGLLAIADLKHQLKHIASITTYYYADGGKALLLSGLLLDDETYSELNEYIVKNTGQTDTILRKELISILDDSKHTLFGPGLMAVKQFTESIKQSSNPDREWSDLAKEGAIKTKELPHGWCITTQPCDDFANQNLSQCFNCANGVLDRNKSIALINEAKKQAKRAKNEFNKRNFTLLATRIEKAATTMYPNLFKN
ncbi:hypothetical protein [Methylobacter sp. BlB1]|uniref:hypothetical protein n=1 Tax=Methylobacter sp. BlB1 TaxID=2785914 RepID=UPI0018958DB2|nr:hypothetical protein [Methylobacter sp. BlB1]MBF6650717.1 hypothetical protein [Methylobacter sp. BlB1]